MLLSWLFHIPRIPLCVPNTYQGITIGRKDALHAVSPLRSARFTVHLFSPHHFEGTRICSVVCWLWRCSCWSADAACIGARFERVAQSCIVDWVRAWGMRGGEVTYDNFMKELECLNTTLTSSAGVASIHVGILSPLAALARDGTWQLI